MVGVGAIALVAAALLVPGAQGTPRKHGVFTFPASGPTYSFSLRDKAGYRLSVEAERGGPPVLTVSRKHASNEYFPVGHGARKESSEEGRIGADLGGFGRLDVVFVPSGKPKSQKPLPGCHGGPEITEPGVFVGVVRFRGEGGFAEFQASRVPGTVTTSPRLRCPGFGPGGANETGPKEAGAEGFLDASTPDGKVNFVALGIKESELSASFFLASMTKSYPHVLELSKALFLSFSGQGFEVDQGLTKATVHPGAPFHGSATFQRSSVPGVADQWSGSLRVAFLDGAVALTGNGIEATLTSKPESSSSSGGSFSTISSQDRAARVEQRALSLP